MGEYFVVAQLRTGCGKVEQMKNLILAASKEISFLTRSSREIDNGFMSLIIKLDVGMVEACLSFTNVHKFKIIDLNLRQLRARSSAAARGEGKKVCSRSDDDRSAHRKHETSEMRSGRFSVNFFCCVSRTETRSTTCGSSSPSQAHNLRSMHAYGSLSTPDKWDFACAMGKSYILIDDKYWQIFIASRSLTTFHLFPSTSTASESGVFSLHRQCNYPSLGMDGKSCVAVECNWLAFKPFFRSTMSRFPLSRVCPMASRTLVF